MFIAELQGKLSTTDERKEDILTSNVFSFFKYANRQIFLKSFLNQIGIQLEKHEYDNAEFIFWPTYQDRTEPDLVILVGRYYLLIEAKLYSGFGKASELSAYQLSREIAEGKLEAQNLEKEFRLIAVTAHYAKHQFLAENPEFSLSDITWVNWHQIALLLYKILNADQHLDNENKSFATDLYNLLIKKNLRKYAGQEILVNTSPLIQISSILFFDAITAKYRGDFIGFQQSLTEFSLLQPVNDLFFDRPKKKFFDKIFDRPLPSNPNDIFFER